MKRAARTWNIAGQMPLISLIVLCAASALLTDRFLSPFNLTNILVQSSIIAVIAMGMTFVIIGGGFDLSVGSTAALSGCIASMVMLEAGIVAGVAAGIIAGAAVGLANGLVIAFLNVNPFITTLGTMVLVRGVVFLITGGAPVSGDSGLPGEFVAFGSGRFHGIHYLVWVPALLLPVLSFVMHATPYGRRVYATGGGREAAYLSGVAVRRVVASTYVWCGALAGVAGVMLAARLQSGQPTAGEFYELTAIAAAPLGADGMRVVRYVNPATGGAVMPTLDCYAARLDKGTTTRRKRATHNVVCLVVAGEGRSTIGEQNFEWSQHDVFTIPHWTWARHEARGDADLFMVTDKTAFERLDLVREEMDQ